MKIKFVLLSMLAAATLASCSKESDAPAAGDLDAAYMSIKVLTPSSPTSRAAGSDEKPAEDYENAINSLYAVTFDASDLLVHHAKEDAVQQLAGTLSAPNSVRVSSKTDKILLIANPGTEMLKVINAAYAGQSFALFNAAITQAFVNNTAAKPEILVNEIRTLAGNKNATPTYSNFTMANSDGLVKVAKIYIAGTTEYPTETAAKDAADNESTKQTIKIERLTAKIVVKGNNSPSKPAGSYFQLATDFWTLDVLNSTFFPYAKKTQLTGIPHANPGFYANAFYTEDPNFTGYTGLKYNNLIGATMTPNVTWLTDSKVDYAIENTMAAASQLYENMTRVVLKATYYPVSTWSGDWYRYSGKNYETLELLKADYAAVESSSEANNVKFVAACDEFFTIVKGLDGTAVTATKFAELTQAMLDASTITNGGEWLKNPDGCVRWYQDGLNYYYYQIRHDNSNDASMNFGKYGVVRNNYYQLTLSAVKGPGTPWYPSVNPDPDPTDPDYPDPKPDPDPEPEPTDPVDETTGYISFEVEVGPWLYWETGMEI